MAEEIPDIQFPIMQRCEAPLDHMLTNKLPLELFLRHEGHKVVVENDEFQLRIMESEEHPKDSLRALIRIHPECWAIHWYGTLELPEIRLISKEGLYVFSGGKVKLPRFFSRVELTRDITEEDIRNIPRFGKRKLGESTLIFNNPQDAYKRAEYISRTYFPGFKLIYDSASRWKDAEDSSPREE